MQTDAITFLYNRKGPFIANMQNITIADREGSFLEKEAMVILPYPVKFSLNKKRNQTYQLSCIKVARGKVLKGDVKCI